jgi:hypothetical protein
MTTPGLHPVSGEGVLSRHGQLILLCSAGGATDAVLALHEEVAHSGGDGTALADRLSALLSGTGGVNVVAFGPAGRSVIVAVFGHAWADVATEHGEQRLALRQSSDGVRSVLPGMVLSIRAGLGDIDTDATPQQWGNLEHGTVHAAGLLYVLSAGAAPVPTDSEPAPDEPVTAQMPVVQEPIAEPAPVHAPPTLSKEPAHAVPEPQAPVEPDQPTVSAPPAVPDQPAVAEQSTVPAQPAAPPEMPAVEETVPDLDRSQPFSSVVLVQAAAGVPQAPEREPLPIAAPPPEPAPEVAPASHPLADHGIQVLGVYCKNGHFDDPSARYCAICGISMAQLTLVPRPGPRPPLGVLVLDDGSIFSLETDYVIGRDPSRDERVAAGDARPLRLEDSQGLISRAHVQIRLDGWQVQVVDLGSANGTGIWGPGESAWRAAPRLTPVPIRPGTQIGFGQRQLRYESHRNT